MGNGIGASRTVRTSGPCYLRLARASRTATISVSSCPTIMKRGCCFQIMNSLIVDLVVQEDPRNAAPVLLLQAATSSSTRDAQPMVETSAARSGTGLHTRADGAVAKSLGYDGRHSLGAGSSATSKDGARCGGVCAVRDQLSRGRPRDDSSGSARREVHDTACLRSTRITASMAAPHGRLANADARPPVVERDGRTAPDARTG